MSLTADIRPSVSGSQGMYEKANVGTELGDKVFQSLVGICFNSVSGIFSSSSALPEDYQYLVNQGYITAKPYVSSFISESYTLEITEEGLLLLLQDRLRLIKALTNTSFIQVAIAFILNINKEELPELLSSGHEWVRFAAKVRLDELIKDENV